MKRRRGNRNVRQRESKQSLISDIIYIIKQRKPKRKFILRKFQRFMQKKLAITSAVIVLALFALCIRIVYINVASGDKYSITVLNQQEYVSKVIPFKRGEILDRNGNSLATSIKVYNLVIDSKIMLSNEKYLEPTISAINKYLGTVAPEKMITDIKSDNGNFDLSKLVSGIKQREKNSYWVVMKQLTYEEARGFLELLGGKSKEDNNTYVKGVWFEEEYKRMYPFENLACSLIGFANKDGSADTGIEAYYADELKGVNGREYGYVNDESNMESVVKEPTNGNTVVSTIDVNVQRIVQEKIAEYMVKYEPKRLAVVIADPNTGEIIAMADDMTFNLNDPRDLSGYYTEEEIDDMSETEIQANLNGIWRNFCVSDSFEPGSTFKPFTIAAAYEEAKVDKTTTCVCDGSEFVGGFNIGCHKETGHGNITIKEALAYSCNDSMMWIGNQIGPQILADYQTRFGFGFKTGVDLPSETRGLVYEAEDMGPSTIATNSFGQNFTVNMVQMTAAFGSVINGGYYYEPHVVKEIQTEDGHLIKNFTKRVVRQTVTKDTCEYIKEGLRAVVTDGTGKNAAIEGYTIGGKTGTAEKVNTSGDGIGRIENEYILSFIGCVPCENPEVICYTIMDTPKDDPDSTAYNLDFWTAIMKEVLPYLHIQKTDDAGKDEDITGTKSDDISENYEDGIIHGEESNVLDEENQDNTNEDGSSENETSINEDVLPSEPEDSTEVLSDGYESQGGDI